jgi:hypothetical protein
MPDLNRTLQLMRRAHTDWHRGDWKELRLVSGVRGGGGGLVTNTATRQPEPVVLRSKKWSWGACETACQKTVCDFLENAFRREIATPDALVNGQKSHWKVT